MSAWRIRLETHLGAIATVAVVAVLALIAAVVFTVVRPGAGTTTSTSSTVPTRTVDEVIADPRTDPACRDALRELADAPPAGRGTPSADNPFGVDSAAGERARKVSQACAGPSGD